MRFLRSAAKVAASVAIVDFTSGLDDGNESEAARGDDPGQSRASTDGKARWYAVQTRPHREFGAAGQLEMQGYCVFLPHRAKTVRHARRLMTVDAPFFPRYLFVRLDLSRDRWRPINGTFGVAQIVMGRDQPLPAPVGIVEALQARFSLEAANGGEDLRPGDRVQVTLGPFANLIGELERLDGAARVRVLLEVMGAASVSLERRAVVKLRDEEGGGGAA